MSKAETQSNTSAEKTEDVSQIENASVPSRADLANEARIVRKIDWRILLILGLLYSVALIDRNNMSVAFIAGMRADLALTVGDRYSLVSCMFFLPYIILQIPSNLILRRFQPVYLLSTYVIAWGAVQLGMGFVKNWEQLLVTRALLGALEAGFFPGMIFIITTWYKRHEVQKRLAIFYLISLVCGGFSAILAYALQLLRGNAGLNGWRWIFIIEGILTIVSGFIAYLYIPNFPDQNKFLSKEDTAVVLERVDRDRGDAIPDPLTTAKVFSHLRDWTIWAYALMFLGGTLPSYAISYFIVIILSSMGYNTRDTLLLAVPPYIVAAISCYCFAIISDKMKTRAPFLGIQIVMVLIGLFITAYSNNNGARYFGLFLVGAGASGCVPGVTAWNANNIVGQSKRSVATALIVSFGGIGGVMATTVFRQADYPRYLNGFWATIGSQFLSLLMLCLLSFTYKRRNRLVREGKLVAEGQPGFLYTI